MNRKNKLFLIWGKLSGPKIYLTNNLNKKAEVRRSSSVLLEKDKVQRKIKGSFFLLLLLLLLLFIFIIKQKTIVTFLIYNH
jgi:hypothetical protein